MDPFDAERRTWRAFMLTAARAGVGGGLLATLAAVALAGCGDIQSIEHESRPSRIVMGDPPRTGAAGERASDPAALFAWAAPSVVTVISVTTGGGVADGLGSGFVVRADGLIATNAHVVVDLDSDPPARAADVYVEFATGDRVAAEIAGVDLQSDIALLRLIGGPHRLRPLLFARSERARIGERVLVIGSPYGEQQSLSVGVISGLGRTIEGLAGFPISGAIQTDAAINAGNSGGPLLDARGHVLGMNAQIKSTGGGGEGVGFAIASSTVDRAVRQLATVGYATHPYVGVESQPVYPQLAREFNLPAESGALVGIVRAGSPADRAGLRGAVRTLRFQGSTAHLGGDLIIGVDGVRLRPRESLAERVALRAPGEVITVDYYRGERLLHIPLKLGARPVGR